ncbi:MAG: hypothetical protein JNL84_14750 [Candidatus Accumulibacter sp.]|nr:hypothetical protein [Accumulibacter sp.]
MGRTSYRERINAASASAEDDPARHAVDPTQRTIRAIWADDPLSVPIVRGFRDKFAVYPRDSGQRTLHLNDFDVCPLAGDASRAAQARTLADLSADDFVLVFSDALQQTQYANAVGNLFRFFTREVLAQADAPVFWLGAAQKVDTELATIGDTPLKAYGWQILHRDPPGRFRRENSVELDDDLAEAVHKVLHFRKTDRPGGGEASPPPSGGLFGRLRGLFHS